MRKDSQLSVRISEEQMTNLREQANRESVLLSQLVRCILAANNRQTGITSLLRRFADDEADAHARPGISGGPDPTPISGANSVGDHYP